MQILNLFASHWLQLLTLKVVKRGAKDKTGESRTTPQQSRTWTLAHGMRARAGLAKLLIIATAVVVLNAA